MHQALIGARRTGLSPSATERKLRLLERLFPPVFETQAAYDYWKEAIAAYRVIGVQVHDVRLVGVMKAHGISSILTLNKADFVRYSDIVPDEPGDVLATSSSG